MRAKRITNWNATIGLFVTMSLLSMHNKLPAGTIDYFEGFDDDFVAGRNVPDADVGISSSLSSPFDVINGLASGYLCLRDRHANDPGGDGGGFPPQNNVYLDFTYGGGSNLTMRLPLLSPGYVVGDGSYLEFDVVGAGSDAGHLYKFVSSDGVNFDPVGDDSDEEGTTFHFDLLSGSESTYFRIQTGTSGGAYEGVWIDNIKAHIIIIPEPAMYVTLLAGGILLSLGTRRHQM